MHWLRALIFPPWTISTSPGRTWLHAGFRFSLVAIGACIVTDVSGWYLWLPVGAMVLCFVLDLLLYRTDMDRKRSD